MSKRDEYKRMVAQLSPEDRARHKAAWITWLRLLVEKHQASAETKAVKLLEACGQ